VTARQELLDELTVERYAPVPRANYTRRLEWAIRDLTRDLAAAERERTDALSQLAAAQAHIARIEARMLEHRCAPMVRVA
jgi:hypothetical protein